MSKLDLRPSELNQYWENEDDGRCNITSSLEEFNTMRLYKRLNDKKLLLLVLRSNRPISNAMRNFIAEQFDSKKTGRKHNPERDHEIAIEVHRLLQTTNHLRENKQEPGAATVIGKKHNLSEEAIIKIYNSVKQGVDLDETIEYLEKTGKICICLK